MTQQHRASSAWPKIARLAFASLLAMAATLLGGIGRAAPKPR